MPTPRTARREAHSILLLPLVAAPASSRLLPRGTPVPRRRASAPVVLIVEDDGGYGYLERLAAIESGWEAVLASNGSAAIAELRSRQPDAVVLGLNLHGEDGRAVWDRMRALEDLEEVPVVFVSGSEAPAEQLPPGASYRHKPATMAGLIEIFGDLMARLAPRPEEPGKLVTAPETVEAPEVSQPPEAPETSQPPEAEVSRPKERDHPSQPAWQPELGPPHAGEKRQVSP